MDGRVVADQWVFDVSVFGSRNQNIHVDYERPLFPETPDVTLPAYMLVLSFALIRITPDLCPIDLAKTHIGCRIVRRYTLAECGHIPMLPVTLNIGGGGRPIRPRREAADGKARPQHIGEHPAHRHVISEAISHHICVVWPLTSMA
jgi:hypothetical protein